MRQDAYRSQRAQPRSPRGRPWAVLGSAIDLALLGILTVVLLVLLAGKEDDVGSASPAASTRATGSSESMAPSLVVEPSVSPPEPSADASTPQSASPMASKGPGIALPDGLLPSGSVVRITGDGVRLRTEPTTAAEIVATMSSGDFAYVVDDKRAGPVDADGYNWYSIEYVNGTDVWPYMDLAPDDLQLGWVAAGNDSQRFMELADVECPAEPPTLEVLAFEMTSWERLVCLSDGPVTIDAADYCRQEGFGGCGGTTPGAAPTWLADATQHAPMVLPGNREYPSVRVAIPPDLSPAYHDLPLGRVVRITLHVDDPAASTCVLSEPDETGRIADPEAVHVWCRERLVMETFEDVGENAIP